MLCIDMRSVVRACVWHILFAPQLSSVHAAHCPCSLYFVTCTIIISLVDVPAVSLMIVARGTERGAVATVSRVDCIVS
jgi:hypothetical protein